MTESYKFKKGDRVRLVRGRVNLDKVKIGATGTVMEDDCRPWVSWDGLTDSFNGSWWSALEDDLELVEPSVEAFKIGQLVQARLSSCGLITEFIGEVVESNYPPLILVRGPDGMKAYCKPDQLTSIEQAPTSPPKPECYVTAWSDLDGWFYLTEYTPHPTKEAADAHAKALVSEHSEPVAVFKLVSKHSSAVTVTSEDV